MNENNFKDRIVAVCDPDKDMLKRFCEVFKQLGFEEEHLICTQSIKDTLEFAIENDPDIIFIDMHIKESGYTICGLLDSANHDLHIPVMLMSYPEQGIGPMRGIALRGRGFLPKPIQMLQLQSKLIKIFRERDLEKMLFGKSHVPKCGICGE